MTSLTMPAQVLGDEELEQLEAAFLRLGPWETGAPELEIPPVLYWPAGDGPTCWITRYKTRSGCCG